MNLKIREGKTFQEIVEILELNLPESISEDEILGTARLIHNTRGNTIVRFSFCDD